MTRIARNGRNSLFHLVPALVLAAGMAWSPAFAAEREAVKLSAEELTVEDIKGIVRDYLLENPEIIREALQVLEVKEKAAQAEKTRRAIAARSDELFNDPASPVGGNNNGDVTVVEFFDYNCGFCRRVAPTVEEIKRQDTGVRFVYKEFPILGPTSIVAAKAALASRAQGKYVAFHEALMKVKGGRLSEDQIMKVAESVGLDTARLKKEMEEPAITESIDRNRALASALGVTGTPSFVVGDDFLRGARDLQAFKELIQQTRSK